MTEPQAYIATRDGWVAGRPVRCGDWVLLTPAQAAYEHVTPEKVTNPAPRPRRVRTGGQA